MLQLRPFWSSSWLGSASTSSTWCSIAGDSKIWSVEAAIRISEYMMANSPQPGPPHHPIFGHLKAIGEVTQKLPKMIHPHVFALEVKKAYKLPSIFYMDIVPFGPTILYVMDP
jgi:hypothetical protein